MTFITALIALLVERFFDWTHIRHWNWLTRYKQWMSTKIKTNSPYLSLALFVAPPAVIVALVDLILSHWLYGIPRLIFSVLVLMYCFGPDNLWAQTYLSVNDPKMEKAQQFFHFNASHDSQAAHQSFTRAIFIEAHQRVFVVVFWFIFLGPFGAVAYRLLALEQQPFAEKMKQWLDWIPARVFTFFFALGGHFIEVFSIWKKGMTKGTEATQSLIADCGIASLDVVKENKLPEDGTAEKHALALLDRTFIIGLVVLAAVVLLI